MANTAAAARKLTPILVQRFLSTRRPRSITNVGDDPAAFLVILSPPGNEGFWREMAALRAHLGGPPDEATTLALQRKHHLTTGGQPRRFS